MSFPNDSAGEDAEKVGDNLFVDSAKIFVKGGDGGNGIVAFQREKYVPFGGPSGGDGGNGGDVVFRADESLRTLVDFKHRAHFKAYRGMHGQGDNKTGKSGKHIVVSVPPGTLVKDADSGEIIADLVKHGDEAVVARGGRGGRGNQHFASATNKAPRRCEDGQPGEERWLVLELKLLADVGLTGLPNAGKSTLLASVSAARPKIADYPFTTIQPNLGVVKLDTGRSFALVDIPGLIEGAHEGKGLGHRFLRHVERTKVLVHVLDMSGQEGRDPVADFHTVQQELEAYNPELSRRPTIIAANKMDLPESEDNLERLKVALGDTFKVYAVSAVTRKGVKELMYAAADLLDQVSASQLDK